MRTFLTIAPERECRFRSERGPKKVLTLGGDCENLRWLSLRSPGGYQPLDAGSGAQLGHVIAGSTGRFGRVGQDADRSGHWDAALEVVQHVDPGGCSPSRVATRTRSLRYSPVSALSH